MPRRSIHECVWSCLTCAFDDRRGLSLYRCELTLSLGWRQRTCTTIELRQCASKWPRVANDCSEDGTSCSINLYRKQIILILSLRDHHRYWMRRVRSWQCSNNRRLWNRKRSCLLVDQELVGNIMGSGWIWKDCYGGRTWHLQHSGLGDCSIHYLISFHLSSNIS